MGLAAGINLYAYVANNPLLAVDPQGLMAKLTAEQSLIGIQNFNSAFNQALFSPLVLAGTAVNWFDNLLYDNFDITPSDQVGFMMAMGGPIAGEGFSVAKNILTELGRGASEVISGVARLASKLDVPVALQGVGDGSGFIETVPTFNAAEVVWKGSGPTPGVLGVNSSSNSIKALQNYYPKGGGIEFVFDQKTNTFATGDPKLSEFIGSPHQKLAQSIAADESTVVGGIFRRSENGAILTNENSGHYWQNWTPEVKIQFEEVMSSYGIPVIHTEGM